MSSNDDNTTKSTTEPSEMDQYPRRRFGRHLLLKIPLAIAIVAIVGTVVRLLWNHLIPELFNGPEIRFTQAIGLLVLSKILFGFGGGGFRRFGMRHHHYGPEWRGRWMEMSPEERQKLRDEFRRRHHHHPRS